MNKKLPIILKFLIEVLAATTLWCLLDFWFDGTVNIVSNLIDVIFIVLFGYLFDYFWKKRKKK